LALLVLSALTVWIVCICSPRITAKRFLSDVYTCNPVTESGEPVPGTCVVRWSLTERVVTMTISLALNCSGLKGPDVTLLLDLMLPPAKATPRYLAGFGMSSSGARCFVEPVEKSGTSTPQARLRLTGLGRDQEQVTAVAQMMV
jgi:hypothetical protein